MMFKFTGLFLFFCLLTALTYAQLANIRTCKYQSYQTVEGEEDKVGDLCNLYDGESSDLNAEEAISNIDEILDKVGLFRNFSIQECEGINNAIAVTISLENGDMDRFILFDNLFFKQVKSTTGTNWGLVSILAHEVGHHLNGHTLRSGGSNHQIELQADEFSGFVLGRMDCTLEDAQSAVSEMLPDLASTTHPGKVERLQAIAKGWQRGSGKKIPIKGINKEIEERIIQNTIDQTEVETQIKPDQILLKYIEAIGGEEKIREIKTLEKTSSMRMAFQESSHFESLPKKVKNKLENDFLMETRETYFSPSKTILNILNSGSTVQILRVNGRPYIKQGKEWIRQPIAVKDNSHAPQGQSYIYEYAALVSNVELKLRSIERNQGETYYVVEFPPTEIYTEDKLTGKSQMIRYYNVRTGFLERMQMLSSVSSATTLEVIGDIYYKNYLTETGLLYPVEDYGVLSSGANMTSKIDYENHDLKINPSIDEKAFQID